MPPTLSRFSFSAGLRDEIHGSGEHEVSPTFTAGVWLRPAWKVRASVSRAFRLPTYTDLYYQDPANLGSPDLRPERAVTWEAGVDWNAGGRVRAGATVFHRREKDGIDYVRASPTDIWRATNFQRLQFTGMEAHAALRAGARQQIEASYTLLDGAQDALAGYLSKYVFNYPEHNAVFGWYGEWRGLTGRTRAGVTRRFARSTYAVWDLYGAVSRGRARPFLQFTNLGDTNYEEIPGVPMPGRAVVGGIELIAWGGQ
jgi:iron complex outermembrane receptor protein